jgi:hypothetical protein
MNVEERLGVAAGLGSHGRLIKSQEVTWIPAFEQFREPRQPTDGGAKPNEAHHLVLYLQPRCLGYIGLKRDTVNFEMMQCLASSSLSSVA